MNLQKLSNSELSDLKRKIEFEQGVRRYMTPPRCITFMSPGPPWYAACCRKERGHSDEHDFGTKEKAQERWESNSLSYVDEREAMRREAEWRLESNA